MKIKWLIEDRLIPGIGLLKSGDVKDVPDEIGLNLIRQGEAAEFIPTDTVIQPHSVVHKTKTKTPGGGE